MIQDIKAALPDPDVLLSLAPQELARVLLPIFKRHRDQIHLHNLVNHLHQMQEVYPRHMCDGIGLAISEAWTWLATQGLIVRKPRDMGNSFSISRTAEKIASDSDFDNFAKAALLPRNLLHPKIAADAWANFLRGAHDLRPVGIHNIGADVIHAVDGSLCADGRPMGADGTSLSRQADRPWTERQG